MCLQEKSRVMSNKKSVQEEIPLPAWPVYGTEEIEAVSEVLRAGKGNYWFGEHGRKFEKEFANYCGTAFALTAANGTLALEMALHGLGIGQGDEVIVTPRSFVASANCIVQLGATPVFADVDRESQNITVSSIKDKVTSKTRGIITVHLAGWPCEMKEIVEFANEKGIYVIEDCAQAHGAEVHDKRVGSWGHASAFSFCQDKIISTGGEGGMLVTNDEEIWAKAAALRNHGKDPRKYNPATMGTSGTGAPDAFGSNYRMTEMQSCMGRIQLGKLDQWLTKRRNNATKLDEALAACAVARTVKPPKHIYHAYYKYYFFINLDMLNSDWDRARLIKSISESGIPCSAGTSPEIYRLEAYSTGDTRDMDSLPSAKELGETSIMLPVQPNYDEDCISYICNTVCNILNAASI